MSSPPVTAALTIWCNSHFPQKAAKILEMGTQGHRLIVSHQARKSNLVGGGADPLLMEADIVLGQPDVQQIIASPRLRWIQLDSAGYTRYDRPEVRDALRTRGAVLTNSSSVYSEPCAQHVLSMMLAMARQLPYSLHDQQTTRSWHYTEHRKNSHLLGKDQTVLILGFGSIARRLAELLKPFGMNVVATRRAPKGDESIPVLPESQANDLLSKADHVINILPDNPSTAGYFDVNRFARLKPTAYFYNIGRGTTVDQDALIAALFNRKIAGAFLDVTDPEPLPPDHPLWRAPNCFITPHTGGGHHNEFERLVRHFLDNLARFQNAKDLADRVV
jgi:phosphoglycerate dehydrogenase-like enzyme